MFFLATPRIYLREIAKQINKKDVRTAKKWCSKNFLKIHKDSSGEFAYQNDFDLAYDMPLINELKLKYGEHWQDYYLSYNRDELYKMLDLNQSRSKGKTGYVPKGKLSSKLFRESLK